MVKKSHLRNQKGMGIGAIIGIVALLAVLGAVVASSLGGGSTNTSSEQDKLNASSILMQSGSLKDGADLLVAKYRSADYDLITLSSAWTEGVDYGMYNAANGTLEYMVPPKAAFETGETAEWEIVDSSTSAVDFDGSGVNDGYVQVTGLTTSVCEAINVALGLDESVTPTTTGRTAYCEADATPKNIYYKAIKVQ